MDSTGIGIYCRISDDQSGEALGIQRQESDCRSLAALRGWAVVDTYIDNDVSAYKPGVVRPQFERMLKDLTSGRLRGVVVYDLDRFARQPRDLERAIDVFETQSGVFATVQGDINLASTDGMTMARVMIAFANKSSRDTARRVARKWLRPGCQSVACVRLVTTTTNAPFDRARPANPCGGSRPVGWEGGCPEFLELRWRSGEHQAELTFLVLHSAPTFWAATWREDVLPRMSTDGDLTGYLFRCLHCGTQLAYADAS